MRRLPFEPLWRYCVMAHDEPLWDNACGFNVSTCARMLDRSTHWVHVARREGLSERVADECAVRLNTSPLIIWGREWHTAAMFDGLTPRGTVDDVDALFTELSWVFDDRARVS